MDPVASFEALCAGLQAPATAAQALRQLEELRTAPGTLGLVRAVLERSSSESALMHAATMLKVVIVREWVSFGAADKAGLRPWCVSLAEALLRRSSRAAAGQVLLAAAVAAKRGWLEGDAAERADDLVAAVNGLISSTTPSEAWLGARLAVLLVQEFDGSSGSRSTALGQTSEFHAVVAGRFQAAVLAQLCAALVGALVATLRRTGGGALPVDLVNAQLEAVAECLAWDFSGGGASTSSSYARIHGRGGSSGGGGGGALGRVCPGRAWQGILVDADAMLVRAVLALYGGLRAPGCWQPSLAAPARLCRSLLLALCTLAGDVFPSSSATATHAAVLVSGLGSWLAAPLLSQASPPWGAPLPAVRAAATAAGARLGEEAAFEWALDEACDAAAGLGALIRCTPAKALLAATDVPALLGHAGDFAGALLAEVAAVSQRARASLAAGGGSSASTELEAFTASRLRPVMGAVQACLEVWGEAVSALDGAAIAALSLPLPPDVADRLSAAQAGARIRSPALYERVVSARLHLATVSVLAGLDDDDPFEDESALTDHMDAVAVVGRVEPASSLACLTAALAAARGRLASAGGGGGTGGGEPRPDVAATAEECWWLLGFAGHLLADEAKGEAPLVPETLRALSQAAARAAPPSSAGGAGGGIAALAESDPVIRASSAALSLCEAEAGGSGQSPLLTAQVLWFLARWARTYALPDAGLYESRPLSKALAACYGSDPGELHAALAAGLGRPSPLGLAVLPTRPGLLGGRAVLDFVVQVAASALRRWGVGGGEERVVRHAIWALRALTNNATAARAAVMSAAWEQLVAAVLAMVRGDAGSTLVSLPPETQGRLVSLVLAPTRCIGAETAEYEAAEGKSGPEVLETLQEAAVASAAGRALPTATPVVARWHAYFSTIATAVAGTLSRLPPDTLRPPITPATLKELDRVLSLHAGLLHCNTRVPGAWYTPAATKALAVCPSLVLASLGRGQLCSRALHYACDFFDLDVFLIEEADVAPLYASVVALFRAFFKHHAGSVPPPRAPGGGGGDDEEADTSDDLLQLLGILDKIVDAEDLELCMRHDGHQSRSDAPGTTASASSVVIEGLSCLMPLLTQGLLAYPGLAAAFLNLVSQLVLNHPAQAVSLPADLFGRIVSVLQMGLQYSADTQVVRQSLEALHALGSLHASRGSTPGLAPVLGPFPDLLRRLLCDVLVLTIGPLPCPTALIAPAATAFLALLAADPAAFTAMAQSLVERQPSPEVGARLAREFETLTSANGVTASLSRPNVRAFCTNFEGFVERVRSFTAIK